MPPFRSEKTEATNGHGPSHERNGDTGPKEGQDRKGEGKESSLRPYRFLGVVFAAVRPGDTQGVADCPLCGKEGKCYVSLREDPKEGLYDCKSCGERGNVYRFLVALHELSLAGVTAEEYQALAQDRGLLYPETLARWKVGKSPLTGEWLLPGYNAEGVLNQLYRYGRLKDEKTGGWYSAWLGTPGLGQALFNVPAAREGKGAPGLYVCEGPWDGMALEEVLLRGKRKPDGGLSLTSSPLLSALTGVRVVAVPGANTFLSSWCSLFAGKRVSLLYDNDHPRQHPQSGKEIEGAGAAGVKRATSVLSGASEPPESVAYLRWGPEGGGAAGGTQWNLNLPSGYDVRDLLKGEPTIQARFGRVAELERKLVPVPPEWVQKGRGGVPGSVLLEPLECRDWKTLDNAWRKAMKWTEGLRGALVNMLACASSTLIVGEQLWMLFTSPPSTGKTTLAEGLSVDRQHVIPKDTFNSLFSGYQVDKEGSENISMVLKMNGKCLIVKDADTVLQHPNKRHILSQFRALYDRAVRTQYSNKMSMDHDNINTTVILCGTPSLRVLDDSELGQRTLSYRIMTTVDADLEQEINLRSLNHFFHQVTTSPRINGEGADTPEKVLAKRLTGGYLLHLIGTIEERLMSLSIPEGATAVCNDCGRFVAYFRARPSLTQNEEVQRELSTRLVLQHAKLAVCVSVVLGKSTVDEEVLERVRQVARDTAYGRTLDIARLLYVNGDRGADTKQVATYLADSEEGASKLLRFLRRIGAVEVFEGVGAYKIKRRRWRLKDEVKTLYASLIDPDGSLLASYADPTSVPIRHDPYAE